MWPAALLIDYAADAIALREQQLADEHAVHGLDALDETGWHPLLTEAFTRADLGVLREQPYPHEWRVKRGRRGRRADDVPQPRDRRRCDLVLTPRPGQILADPLTIERAAVSTRRAIEGTLFQADAHRHEADARAAAAAASAGHVAPEDAFWLEVKLVAQHAYNAGIPGPNRTYASELRRTAADLKKLDDDDRIRAGGLLLITLTHDEGVARHDLTELLHLCLDRDLSIASPAMRFIPIRERIGNHVCGVCLIELRKLGGAPTD